MKDTFWKLFELLITLIESFVIIRFLCSFYKFNFKTQKNRTIYIVASLGFAAIILIINGIVIYEGAVGIVYSLYLFLFSLFYLKGKIFVKVLISIGINVCLICVSALGTNIVSVLFYQDYYNYINNGLSRLLSAITVQILLIYVFEIILKTVKKDDIQLKLREWILISVVLIISFIVFAFIHTIILDRAISKDMSHSLAISEIGIIIINIFCFYMVIGLSRSNRTLIEFELYKQNQKHQEQYAEDLKCQHEEIRRFRHDMKHSYIIIETLAKDKKINELLDYLNESTNELKVFDTIINTENSFINAILNTKIKYAKSVNIQVLCSSINKFNGAEDTDLCVLLGNMLDNAIDSCLLCESNNRYMEIFITSDEDKFIISIKNTIRESVLNTNNELKTTKKDKSNHGYGVKTIKHISSKYGGNVNFYEEDNLFCCQVMLYKQLQLI